MWSSAIEASFMDLFNLALEFRFRILGGISDLELLFPLNLQYIGYFNHPVIYSSIWIMGMTYDSLNCSYLCIKIVWIIYFLIHRHCFSLLSPILWIIKKICWSNLLLCTLKRVLNFNHNIQFKMSYTLSDFS